MVVQEEISMKDFEELIKTTEINLIDVREVHEFKAGHVKGAVNFPMSEFGDKYQELAKDEVYYFICRSGNRSGMICEFLNPQGYHGINVLGGMLEWTGEVV